MPETQSSPTISLCMITKNEEHCLRQAIESVLAIVSEVIVVDTGSTDQTVQIATELGARVYHEAWNDDFAAARNISLSHATGDWILVLDADEQIAASDLMALKALTSDRSRCIEFLQRHYTNDIRLSNFIPVTGEFPELEREYAGYFESNLVRMFPNREGLEYRGCVHELVEHSIYELRKHRIERTAIRIHHYGHTEEIRQRKQKGKIYTSLGEHKAKENPTDWKSLFELGIEHNNNGRLEESALALKQSAELNPRYVSTWVNLGYVQCELQRYNEALQSLTHALTLQPGNEEAICNAGVVYLRVGNPTKAESLFRQATLINPRYMNAYQNRAIALAQLGRHSEAAQVLYAVLEMIPQNQTARERLQQLYQLAGLGNEAIRG